MKRTSSLPCPNRDEQILGWFYLLFQLFLLPSILQVFNDLLPHQMSQTELNFSFYLINFLSVILIFHRFLHNSFQQIIRHPAYFLQAVILGAVAYYASAWVVEWCIIKLDPHFANANNALIANLSLGNWYMMAVGTVVLVPIAEECFYRGLVFRTLFTHSRWAAYLVSIAVFALIHILGHIGSYSPLGLVLCFLQYVPAGLCLAWSYTKGESIFAPILIHAFINARSIYTLR